MTQLPEPPPNGFAMAADFRALAERDAFEPPQRVVLPKSGLPVMVRRPRPLAYTLTGLPIPQSLAAKVSAAPATEWTAEERQQMLRLQAAVYRQCFVQPRLSLNPGPDEIHPGWIPAEDQEFLLRYFGGEVGADGVSLDTFHQAGHVAAGGDGAPVSLPPLEPAARQD